MKAMSIVLGAVVVVGLAMYARHQADASRVSRQDVFAACERAVREVSGGDSAVVPFAEPIAGGHGWVVAWSKDSGLRMKSSEHTQSTGVCLFTDGRVQRLVIDETRIIDDFKRVASTS